jgi:transposase
MRERFLIMDNAPIHTAKIIDEMIEEHGYKYIYLPPYFPESNSIEQFWSVVKRVYTQKIYPSSGYCRC